MKMKVPIRYAALFLLSVLFMRCDEETEKPFNYILVTVNVNTVVYEGEMGGNPLAGEGVSLRIVRDDGERMDENKVTDAAGAMSALATFKLYKDQSIEACVELVDLPGNYQCETLFWQGAVAGATESGGEMQYTWTALLDLVHPL